MTSWWLPAASWHGVGSNLGNHLWQTTLLVIAAALLARIVGPRYPSVRHGIWLTASVKFLVPFSVLVSAGHELARWGQPMLVVPALPAGLQTLSQPFSVWAEIPAAHAFDLESFVTPGLVAIWLAGCAVALGFRWMRWRRIAAAVTRAPVLVSGREVDALRRVLARSGGGRPVTIHELVTPSEPGLFGVRHPRLLWPAGLSPRLSDDAIDAIVAHEICHLRRADNLTSLVHTLVEALFWFHPMVWWLGARLLDEREHACDQDVLNLGTPPQTYAESLLKVCRFSLRSPLPFVAGITGSHLSQRVEAIMTYRIRPALGPGHRILLVAVGVLVAAGPVAAGLISAPHEITAVAAPTWARDETFAAGAPVIAEGVSAAGAQTPMRALPPPTNPRAVSTPAPQGAPARIPVPRDTPAQQSAEDVEFRRGALPADTVGLTNPKPLKTVDPVYTSQAMRAKIQGTVELEAVVMPDGTVARARVAKSLDTDFGLDAQALAAIRQWTFEPGTVNGQPVTVLFNVIMHFTLDFTLTAPDTTFGAGAYRGGGITAIRTVDPTYTSEAMRAKIQGTVELEVVVLENGTVGDVRITKSLDWNYGLDQKAIEAVKQWLFRAPRDPQGRPIKAIETLILNFRLY